MDWPHAPLIGSRFRLLRAEDSYEILKWRNNPEVFLFTASRAPISLENHEKWFKERLDKLSTEPIYILENESRLGLFRIDNMSMGSTCLEISILVSPENLGVGIGSYMMNLYFERHSRKGVEKYFARIHKENYRSKLFFKKHNFYVHSEDNNFVLYLRENSNA